MLFEPADWEHMISVLATKTREGKVGWRAVDADVPGMRGSGTLLSVSRLLLGIGDLTAAVGSNTFRLGSSDGDGRAPFFLQVSRRLDGEDVTDTLRSDAFMTDARYQRAADMLAEVAQAAHQYQRERAKTAKSIIDDLDQL